jgi:hypothetical protein
MDEAELRARGRERAKRAAAREQHALELKRIAEQEAEEANSQEAERAHLAEAATHERAAKRHRDAAELQRRHSQAHEDE